MTLAEFSLYESAVSPVYDIKYDRDSTYGLQFNQQSINEEDHNTFALEEDSPPAVFSCHIH